MKTLLVIVGLVVIGGIGLGFYLGYFKIGTDNVDGTSHITLTVEQQKIRDDEKRAADKLHEFGRHTTEKSTAQ